MPWLEFCLQLQRSLPTPLLLELALTSLPSQTPEQTPFVPHHYSNAIKMICSDIYEKQKFVLVFLKCFLLMHALIHN